MLTYIPAGEQNKVGYIGGSRYEDGTARRGGTITDQGDGTWHFKFDTVLPEDYDADATTTLGLAARRDLRNCVEGYDLGSLAPAELEALETRGDEPIAHLIRTATVLALTVRYQAAWVSELRELAIDFNHLRHTGSARDVACGPFRDALVGQLQRFWLCSAVGLSIPSPGA